MNKHHIRITGLTVKPVDETIFSEEAYQITLSDEGGGEFVVVHSFCSGTRLQIDPAEWPYLRDAIDTMVAQCTKPAIPVEGELV
jgi:hypothetical protein